MNKKIIYYTTAKTYRIIIALILSIGINILLLEIFPDRSFVWFLVIYHGYLLSWVTNYVLYGVDYSKSKRYLLICITELLTAAVAILNKNAELAAVTGIFLIMAVVLYMFIKNGRMNGDNDNFNRFDLNDHWFDFINDEIYRIKVSFPLNIENYKRDMGQGYITALGMIISNKYASNYGALIKSINGPEYLCRLRNIKPLEAPKDGINTRVIIARKERIVQIICQCWNTDKKISGSIYEDLLM
jgi:hypothetical protein